MIGIENKMDRESYYYHYAGLLEDVICRLSGTTRKISNEEIKSFVQVSAGDKLQILEDVQRFVSENVPAETIRKVFLGWTDEEIYAWEEEHHTSELAQE